MNKNRIESIEIQQRRHDLQEKLAGRYLREKDPDQKDQILRIMDALGPKFDLRELAAELNVR